MILPYNDINPTERTPFFTWMLIGANVGVFLAMIFFSQSATEGDLYKLINAYSGCQPPMQGSVSQQYRVLIYFRYGLVPENLQPETFFTSMFLHGGVAHLVGNMLFLWITGDNLEDRFGHIPFLLFYFFCGLGAAAAQLVLNPTGCVPMIGASGAIAGVMGAYMVLFPRSKIKVLFIFFPFIITTFLIDAMVWLGFWILFQFISGSAVQPGGGGGVAYGAHIGGFVLGLLIALVARLVGLVEGGVKPAPGQRRRDSFDRYQR